MKNLWCVTHVCMYTVGLTIKFPPNAHMHEYGNRHPMIRGMGVRNKRVRSSVGFKNLHLTEWVRIVLWLHSCWEFWCIPANNICVQFITYQKAHSISTTMQVFVLMRQAYRRNGNGHLYGHSTGTSMCTYCMCAPVRLCCLSLVQIEHLVNVWLILSFFTLYHGNVLYL